MKGIDILIVFMFVLVLASGAYFGYTLYNQSQTPNTPEQNNDSNNQNNNVFCVDNDGDGYGPNCALGADCDDQNPDKNIDCTGIEKLDITLSLTPALEKEKYAQTDEITIKIKAQDIPETLPLDAINLRVSYDATVLEYMQMTDLNPIYKAIELTPENNTIRIELVNEDVIKNNDEILSLVFKPIKAGLADVRVSEDTRIVDTNVGDDSKDPVEYKINTSSIPIEIVGDGTAEPVEMITD